MSEFRERTLACLQIIKFGTAPLLLLSILVTAGPIFGSDYANGRYERRGEISSLTSEVRLSDYGEVQVNRNDIIEHHYTGGAISSKRVDFRDNAAISISENHLRSTGACGAGIYVKGDGSSTITNNVSVLFSANSIESEAYACAAALCMERRCTVNIHSNSVVSFVNNHIMSSAPSSKVYGGAMYVDKACSMEGNKQLIFSQNCAEGNMVVRGGAVCVNSMSKTDLSILRNGSVSFVDNVVRSHARKISASTHEKTTENVRLASGEGYARGAAIGINDGGGAVQISDNQSVVFRRNAEITGNRYRLRSIACDAITDHRLLLAAKNGGEIIFYDGIFASESTTTKFNEAGSAGDIIFTGETTVSDLNEIMSNDKAGRTVSETSEETIASRTSELLGPTQIYCGNLIIRDKAILRLHHLSVYEGGISVERGAQLKLTESFVRIPKLTMNGASVIAEKAPSSLALTELNVKASSELHFRQCQISGRINFSLDSHVRGVDTLLLDKNLTVVLDDEVFATLKKGSKNGPVLFKRVKMLRCGKITVENSKGKTLPGQWTISLDKKSNAVICREKKAEKPKKR